MMVRSGGIFALGDGRFSRDRGGPYRPIGLGATVRLKHFLKKYIVRDLPSG